jgi:hypothetical protein
MVYRVLADAVVVAHFGFILFVAVGPLLAWHWPRVVCLHVPVLVWAALGLTVGVRCPLTPLEKRLRRLAGEDGYEGGFVDHYIEGVVYPGEHAGLLRLVAAMMIVIGYAGVVHRAHAVR